MIEEAGVVSAEDTFAASKGEVERELKVEAAGEF
jgi:hypothetical protein